MIAAPARRLTPGGARHALASLLVAALVLAVTVPGATAVPPDPSTVETRTTPFDSPEATGRFAILDFYADWCVSCKEFEDTTLRNRRVRAALANVVALRADVTANDHADRELMRRLGILGPPAMLFFAPDGSERRRYRLFGFEDADEFSLRVEGATDAA